MHDKLFADKRKNVVLSNKAFIKFFLRKWRNMWNAYQTKTRRKVCETLMKNITSKKIKLHKNLIKSKRFLIIHMRTKRIKLIDYFFFVVYSQCSHRIASANIQNKRYDTFYFFAKIDQRIVNACCATTKRRTWIDFWISRRV
jgi:hypothetical protein